MAAKRRSLSLSLNEDKLLAECVSQYPCLYNKACKEYKERDVVINAWREVVTELEFLEDGMFIL